MGVSKDVRVILINLLIGKLVVIFLICYFEFNFLFFFKTH